MLIGVLQRGHCRILETGKKERISQLEKSVSVHHHHHPPVRPSVRPPSTTTPLVRLEERERDGGLRVGNDSTVGMEQFRREESENSSPIEDDFLRAFSKKRLCLLL